MGDIIGDINSRRGIVLELGDRGISKTVQALARRWPPKVIWNACKVFVLSPSPNCIEGMRDPPRSQAFFCPGVFLRQFPPRLGFPDEGTMSSR